MYSTLYIWQAGKKVYYYFFLRLSHNENLYELYHAGAHPGLHRQKVNLYHILTEIVPLLNNKTPSVSGAEGE